MPKRTFWLITGVAVGAGSSLWAERKVRRTVQQAAARLQPDAIVVEVGRSARQAAGSAGGRVRNAVTSGRDEMQRREEELWSELAVQGGVQPVPAVVPAVVPPGPRGDARAHAASRKPRTLGRLRRPQAESRSHQGK